MKTWMIVLFFSIPSIINAQLQVDFQLSGIPVFGVGYEFMDHLKTELRIGTDVFLTDASVEGILTYDILNKPDYEFYAGLGVRFGDFAGFVYPIGFNFYPFEEKKFGFLIEFAPIIGNADVLRGGLGFRYKFGGKTQ
ncbi:MAG: hypothetical protein OEW75_17575 [Cyclobacteriaceae bacterium]|nr:hypothetical protein [Cyclobacteriaceae bacterium]